MHDAQQRKNRVIERLDRSLQDLRADSSAVPDTEALLDRDGARATSATDDARREESQAGALELGHRLLIVPVEHVADATHKAFAGRATQEVLTGRFLAYGTSSAAAAENGLRVLKGIVERGEPWPRELTRR